jgi:hypothetical protein
MFCTNAGYTAFIPFISSIFFMKSFASAEPTDAIKIAEWSPVVAYNTLTSFMPFTYSITPLNR